MDAQPNTQCTPAGGSGVYERRRDHREQIQASAILFDESAGFAVNGRRVRVFDVSSTDIGFRSSGPAQVGATHRLHMDHAHHPRAGRLRISRCDIRDGQYEIGGEFIQE